MKIGFDGKRAVQNYTGLGNYSRFIADILSKHYPSNEYILYAPKQQENKSLQEILLQRKNIKIFYPKSFWNRKLSSLWRVCGISSIIKKDRLDLFHGLSNELPLNIKKSQTKSIVTIHDLIFLRYPQFYKWIDRHIYAYKFKKACENSNQIIAISEMTKRDIVSFFHINPDKIDVIYQGCDESFKQKVSEEAKTQLKEQYQLPDKYILYVGSIESRKNLLIIIKSLKRLKQDIPLIAIGRATPYTEKVKEYIHQNKMESQVKLLHQIPFAELPCFYQMASLFIYPSYFEGFGIPILEALNSDIPVIAATGSCLEEAGGPHSIYINPDDEEELATQIERIWNNETLAKQMKLEGRKYAQRFEPENIAHDVMKVYQKVLSL